MIINSNGTKPIYIQIAEWLETEILRGAMQADDKMYSQYQLADMLNINPATAAKGITILADQGILYKKRGLGMFVTEAANDLILQKRKEQTLSHLIKELVIEAERLNVSESELVDMINKEARKMEGDHQDGDY